MAADNAVFHATLVPFSPHTLTVMSVPPVLGCQAWHGNDNESNLISNTQFGLQAGIGALSLMMLW